MIDLGELDEDAAPFVEVGRTEGGTRDVYLVDGLWARVAPDGRVQLRSDRHTFKLTHMHNTSHPGAVSITILELSRTDEGRTR